MKRWSIISSGFTISLALVGCGPVQPTSITVQANQPVLASQGYAQLTAAFQGNTPGQTLDWKIVSGSGTILSATNTGATFAAPDIAQDAQVRVRASLRDNPGVYGEATLDVRAPSATQTSSLGAAGGTLTAGAVTVSFPSGALKASVDISLKKREVSPVPLPEGAALNGPAVRLEIPASAIDATADKQINLDAPFAGQPDRHTLMELRVARPDGAMFAFLEPYSSLQHVIHLSTKRLTGLSAQTPATIGAVHTASLQSWVIEFIPITFSDSLGAAGKPKHLIPSLFREPDQVNTGLIQFEAAFNPADLATADCKSDQQTIPAAHLRQITDAASLEPLAGRIPLVLVHGWQAFSDMDGLHRRSNVYPAFCNFNAEGDSFLAQYFGAQGAALRTKYALFSFGYNSYRRIKDNGALFRAALKAAFGATPVVAVAHSMGGLVTNRVAIFEPDLFAAVITLGTPYSGSVALDCLRASGEDCMEAGISSDMLSSSTWAIKTPTDAPLDYLDTSSARDYVNLALLVVTQFDGTKDLTWAFPKPSGAVPNLMLELTNAQLSNTTLEKYTGFYGSGDKGTTFFKILSDTILLTTDQLNDGIVPASSACLSTAAKDNDCAHSRLPTRTATLFDHGQLDAADNFENIKNTLLK
jgi:pimeloyl-ACP methyl ester carboxylesterase